MYSKDPKLCTAAGFAVNTVLPVVRRKKDIKRTVSEKTKTLFEERKTCTTQKDNIVRNKKRSGTAHLGLRKLGGGVGTTHREGERQGRQEGHSQDSKSFDNQTRETANQNICR